MSILWIRLLESLSSPQYLQLGVQMMYGLQVKFVGLGVSNFLKKEGQKKEELGARVWKNRPSWQNSALLAHFGRLTYLRVLTLTVQ